MRRIRPNVAETYARLRATGFSKPFVKAVLPDWWTDQVLESSSGMVEFAGLIKQRLGLVSAFGDDGLLDVKFNVAATKLKQRKDTSVEKVQITTSLASAMGQLALRVYEAPDDSTELQRNPGLIRKKILDQGNDYVTLAEILEYCWSVGIPVLRLATIPAASQKAFGYAVSGDNRHAIVIGLNDRRAARIAFVVAHELGHICLGHVSSGTVLADEVLGTIDETLEEADVRDREENEADAFAFELLRGKRSDIKLDVDSLASASEIALAAIDKSVETRIDPGHLLLSHAFRTRDWSNASLAYRFLTEDKDSIALMSAQFQAHLGSNVPRDASQYLQAMQQY